MTQFPFSAVLGADDMGLALILTAISSDIGGVLVRGEKGTAKSTMVRGLAEIMPSQLVAPGCRFGCDPHAVDASCPDIDRHTAGEMRRPARLVELPVGATEDRVVGSLDLSKALGGEGAEFEPGLLAGANRGILYVDEVNLLHDHLVDLLLDAAAMGRNTVERDGISASHAARFVLVGTMNPEEGELRPQLLDRFGLTVEVRASHDPTTRVEIVRRRLAHDRDSAAFAARFAADQARLTERIAAARALVDDVDLPDRELARIARVCAGFDVDGMRADIVTARAATAHAAWFGRRAVTRDDVRAAARLALPHRRRRNPFDAPGLDEDLLEELLGDDDPEPPGDGDDPGQGDDPGDGDDPGGGDPDGEDRAGSSDSGEASDTTGNEPATTGPDAGGRDADQPTPSRETDQDTTGDREPANDSDAERPGPAPVQATAGIGTPFVTRGMEVSGIGHGRSGRRSRAFTDHGRTVGVMSHLAGRLHVPATISAAARRQPPGAGRLRLTGDDLRGAITEGRETNLVLFVVDASGSMGARDRMVEVKTAVVSLLWDAYRKRDRVAVVTFRGDAAEVALPPTSSVEAAQRCLADLPHGGRTPLAEGLLQAAQVITVERVRDPNQRTLVVLLTDGRATSGEGALARARSLADRWPTLRAETIVVDCETGRFRMGLAADVAARMGAHHLPLPDVAADRLVSVVNGATERKVA